jgi:archaemetzincin
MTITSTSHLAGGIQAKVVAFLGWGAIMLCFGSCGDGADRRGEQSLPSPFQELLPLHKRLGRPAPGDWLDQHPERGQSYQEYVRSGPVRPDRARKVIYVQPLGSFTGTQRKVIRLTAEYMEAYFNLPVRVLDDLPLRLIPAKARRVHPTWKVPQILAPYVLDEILAPRLPKDGVAYIAFTTSDLWPGEGWNFVFGQASLGDRVGVWSLYRYGNPDQNEAAFRLFLLRTIKVGTHETGHMFSMQHCTLYECNMCGSNHLAEMDRRPAWLCPVCLAKLCYATGADPAKRYARLAAFCKANGLRPQQEFFEKSLEVLGGK